MAITSLDKVFTVSDEEYGYASAQLPVAGSDSIGLSCPKITGNLSGIGPDSNSADGIFDNDKACKPTYAKTVSRANGISVTLEKNGLWMAKLNTAGMIPKGTRFTIHFLNGNIDKPYATTR